MSDSESIESELEALKELSTTIAERLDRLSALVPPQKRHLVRLLRAEALGFATRWTRSPTSPQALVSGALRPDRR